jgi:hypothetical protein
VTLGAGLRGEGGCTGGFCGVKDYHVAPGVAWGLWRPIFKALEPALAARLAVSLLRAVHVFHGVPGVHWVQ